MNQTILALIVSFFFATSTMAESIVCPADAPPGVKLAAKELRRYVYLRTGTLLPVGADAGTIVLSVDSALRPQQYRLKSDGRTLAITGGSDIGVLYGAYTFVEKLGVRFYLHGDVVPDEQIPFTLPVLDETRQPLFELRGVNPWGSHPFGFDAWSADDYKAIFTQLAKMRMNFLGFHCYPEGHPYAEPTVWHGLAGDFDAQGRVTLKIIALAGQPVKTVTVKVRPFGGGEWKTIPATHIARAVYEARLPAAREDVEYYVTATFTDEKQVNWPATAPAMNQTVVVW